MTRCMYLQAFLPIILLHLCTFVDACEKFSFVSQENKALKGHAILSMDALCREVCWAKCASILDCFSINIRNNTIGGVDCELNNSSKARDSNDLVLEQGSQYFEIKEQTDDQCDKYQCIPEKEALKDDWFRIGETTFKIFHSNSTWDEARRTCQKLGGDLASVNNSYENEFIHYMFHKQRKSQALRERVLPNLVAFWALDGSDKDVHVHGNTTYKDVDDIRALHFSGLNSWATLPAIKFNPKGYTYMIWIKPARDQRMANLHFYNDWYSPPSFSLVYQKDHQSVYVWAKNRTNSRTVSSYSQGLWNRVRKDVWTHVAVIWNKAQSMLIIVLNGVIAQRNPKPYVDLLETYHSRFYLAVLGNSVGNVGNLIGFHGYMSNLMVFDRVLDEQEIQAAQDWRYHYGPWLGLQSMSDGSLEWSDGSKQMFMNTVTHPSNDRCFAFANKQTWVTQFCNETMPFVCERAFRVN